MNAKLTRRHLLISDSTRITLLAIAMLLGSLMTSPPATALDGPVKVGAAFSRVYVPDGFDDNDQVQFVGEGLFTSLCYRDASPTVRVDHPKKEIFVEPGAYKYEGYCLQVILPFDRVVDVGVLEAGRYRIVQAPDHKVLGEIHVKRATALTPDDYLYAPISQAYVKARGASSLVYLSGVFPAACLKIKEIKFQVQSDVLVVQPVAEIDPGIPCMEGSFPFEARVDTGPMKPGRYLLHVRSMNGKAINSLFDVR